MAHNLDMTHGRANMAFLGARGDIWHGLGQAMKPGQSIEDWAKAAGLGWRAIKVPAFASLAGADWDHIDPSKRFMPVEDRFHVARSDNGHPLGYVSDVYQPVQPAEVLDWFQRYIGVDDRFQIDVAGSLKKGEIIWATASFRERLDIVGEEHKARLLMTTTFDGSGATKNKGTMTRVVCNNTLDAAMADPRATITTRHNTKFNAKRTGDELAAIAQGFVQYKALAEAMVQVHMSALDVQRFFEKCLDIPADAKAADLSGRKREQLRTIDQAYSETLREGTKPNCAWSALNAITRYVDHEKTTRGGDSREEARALSANFGSGSQLKAKAVDLLLPNWKPREKVLVAA